MQIDLYERAVTEAKYIISTKSTVRKTAIKFNISKSTVHQDVTVRLKTANYSLFKKVRKILQKNFNEKHLRGGESTRKKYIKNRH